MQIAIVDFLEKYKETLFPVVRALHEHGATAYLVGGCVRDMVLNLPLKDLDIEVHGIELPDLQNILARFGHVEEVGKKFGVLLLLGVAIDWSLPRTDSSGRKPQVTLQPQLDIKQALQRRDLTMNAMAIDLTEVICTNVSTISTKDIIDPYGGLRDIAAKQLRAVDDAFFIQDPLRMLRVMQFIGRFAMLPVAELDELCANMPLYDVYDDRPLARERIQAEVVKLLLQAFKPSLGFSWLIKIGRAYELFPFLENNKQTLTVVDRLAQSVRDCSTDEQMILFLTALCFNSIAEIHATFDKQVLKNCTDSQKILKAVEILIQILPRLKTLSNVIACKKIATQLEKIQVSFALLSRLTWCLFDPMTPTVEQSAVYCIAKQANVLYKAEEALVQGKDLLAYMRPGPELGRLIDRAYDLQIEENIKDKQLLIERVLSRKI